MKWSIQVGPLRTERHTRKELTHRIRRLRATEEHEQPQKNIKIVSRQETLAGAEWQAERAGEKFLDRQGDSTAVLLAGIEDVFCATAAITTATHAAAVSIRPQHLVGPESSSDNRRLSRGSRALGNGSDSRAVRGIERVPRGARATTTGCSTGDAAKISRQPLRGPPLRRATSDTSVATARGAANVVRTKQRGELLEPSAAEKTISPLPVAPRAASSPNTLRHGPTTKPDQQPPSAATRAAIDKTRPVVSMQDVRGIGSGRSKLRRRNSLSAILYPPTASAELARSGVQDRNNRGTENRPPAVRDDDSILREAINGVGVRSKQRPKSRRDLTSSGSSVQCHEALEAKEVIEREKAKRRARRREKGERGDGTSTLRGHFTVVRRRRALPRSRSAHNSEKAPQQEKKEKKQARREDNPPSTLVAPGELKRSKSLGSVLLPVSRRFHDVGDKVDTRASGAGGGVDVPSVGKKSASTSSSARSRGRGRNRARFREWEDREKIEQQMATATAETAVEGAAASAMLAAAAAVAAAATAAAVAAAQAMETAKGEVMSVVEGGEVAAAVGAHRRNGALVADPPTAETQVAAADGKCSFTPSSSPWVTRHLDFSSAYGLVFLLSDGSVGVLFKDNTKMAVDYAGKTFDYTEPLGPRTTPPGLSPTSSIHEAESGAGGRPQDTPGGDAPDNNRPRNPKRYRYSHGSFPFYLRKKVRILKYIRDNLCLEYGGELPKGGGSTAATTAGKKGTREPLTFVEKWQRAGDTHCFQLSHQTVQVVFSDGTEVLLSNDCQVITFVSEDGKRETQPRQKMEHRGRPEVMKRVRCAEDFMFLMQEGSP